MRPLVATFVSLLLVLAVAGCGSSAQSGSQDVLAKIHAVHTGMSKTQVKQQLGQPKKAHSDYGFTYWSYGITASHMYELEFDHGRLQIILKMR